MVVLNCFSKGHRWIMTFNLTRLLTTTTIHYKCCAQEAHFFFYFFFLGLYPPASAILVIFFFSNMLILITLNKNTLSWSLYNTRRKALVNQIAWGIWSFPDIAEEHNSKTINSHINLYAGFGCQLFYPHEVGYRMLLPITNEMHIYNKRKFNTMVPKG